MLLPIGNALNFPLQFVQVGAKIFARVLYMCFYFMQCRKLLAYIFRRTTLWWAKTHSAQPPEFTLLRSSKPSRKMTLSSPMQCIPEFLRSYSGWNRSSTSAPCLPEPCGSTDKHPGKYRTRTRVGRGLPAFPRGWLHVSRSCGKQCNDWNRVCKGRRRRRSGRHQYIVCKFRSDQAQAYPE